MERQAADPATYCAARAWTLYDGPGYSDAGVSAFGGKNIQSGDLGRFLADAKAGRFGAEPLALLIEDLDRFSRSAPLAILPVLIDDLLNAGITVSVMGKGRDVSAQSIKANPMELHELLFWLGTSHEFSAKLSRRIGHVHQVKREQIREGKPVTPASAPAWIDLDDSGQWVLNDYAAVIRRLLAMAADGYGCHSIAVEFNDEGIPSPGQYRRNQWSTQAKRRTKDTYKAVAWSGASVKQVICNPAIIGDRQVMTPGYKQLVRDWQEKCALLRRQGVSEADLPKHPARTHEAPQRGYYPALVSEEEQASLLASLKRRKPAQLGQVSQVRWIGAGLSFCACGDPIGATCSRRSTHAIYYLRCRGRVNGRGCRRPGTRLLEAQASLLTRISADTFLAMFDQEKGGQKQTALAAAINVAQVAQAEVDRLAASITTGEQAMAAEEDAAVLGVLARRQAQQEQLHGKAKARLLEAQGELQRLQTNPGLRVVAAEAQEQITQLMQAFAREVDTVSDRRAVQRHLQRIGLKVHIDGQEKSVGLQVGDGPIDWQPLASFARLVALGLGATDPAVAWQSPDGDALVVAQGPLSPEVEVEIQLMLAGKDPGYVVEHHD